jgi:hypothetical protein
MSRLHLTYSNSESDKRQSLDDPAIGAFSEEMSGLPVSSPVGRPPQSMTLQGILADLDPLMIAIGLALAASTPGPAGEAGAIAAISFDVSHRRWSGAALSAASMIPVVGYLPAFFKVGWLLFILSRRLKTIEDMLPELHRSPENVESLRDSLGKYYRRLPKIKITRTLRSRLERIMALDDSAQLALAKESDVSSATEHNSTDNPK